MALESDKTTEARRKALRNGEEDPVVVAQRFLNIYRQMHILSPERKEGFDKMLLELSPEIRGLFSSLPGGVMLQDYADDLAEKKGVAKSVHNAKPSGMSEEAHQQAQILATALAKAQAQVQPQPQPQPQSTTGANVSSVVVAPSKLSLDKDFATEFAKIIGGLIEEQTITQKEGLDKLTEDLSKTQLYLAKSMKEGREEQRQEISMLCKTIADSGKEGAALQSKELKNLCQTIADNYKAEREEQHQEIRALCQTIAESQNSINTSLAAFSNEVPSKGLPKDSYLPNDANTQKLIEVVLEGQKQLNLRLDKVEETSLSRANDNKELIAAFEKSQTEIIKSLSNINIGPSNVAKFETDNEKLLKLIGDSQEKLVKAILSTNIQQNNTSQANNNANNIQINTADNSAQILLLVDKIAALQAANEQNLEKAISKTIEEQSKLYDKISSRQTKELAEIFAQSLKGGNLPVYNVAPPAYSQNQEANAKETTNVFNNIDDDIRYNSNNEDVSENVNDFIFRKIEDISSSQPLMDADVVSDDVLAPDQSSKKKKKKKKKKKQQIAEGANNLLSETPKGDIEPIDDIISDVSHPSLEDEIEIIEEAKVDNKETIINDTISKENADSKSVSPFKTENIIDSLQEDIKDESETKKDQLSKTEEIQEDFREVSNFAQEESASSLSSEDWGFGSTPEKANPETENSNDNEAQEWEWVYVNDGPENMPYMEAIGDNSYICSSDLYGQEKVVDNNPPIFAQTQVEVSEKVYILDNTEDGDFVDPYQNSVLKD